MMFGKSKLQFALKSEVDKMLVFRFEDLACQANITNDANNNNKSVYFDISKRFFSDMVISRNNMRRKNLVTNAT